MDTTTRELLRNNLLIQLEAGGTRGVPLSTLHLGAQIASFRVTKEQLADEVSYLEDKGFAAPVEKAVSPENRRYRITAAGRDHLAEEGLA
jgi:hypothetical protein